MPDIYGFRQGPTYQPMTQADFWQSAFDQPLSAASTFGAAAKSGALESFGLGTVARDIMTPSGNDAPEPTGNSYVDAVQGLDDLIAPRNVFKRLAGTLDRSQPSLSEEDWKASANYREGIPYDPAMTEQRAASLAYQYDQKKVRDFYTQKRPITSFLGQFAGQAADPINFIPIIGPEVKAAALARAGKIAGETLVGSAEAVANTAIFGVATARTRAKFGDDVSWQAMLSDMAMAGLIGGAAPHVFRGIGKTFDAFRDRFTDRASTLENVQQGRLALNEAIDGMVHEGEVRLGPNSIEPIERVAAEMVPARPDVWGIDGFEPKDLADKSVPQTVYHGTSKGEFNQFDPYSGEYGLMGAGSYFTESPAIAAEYTAKGKGSSPAIYEAKISAESPMDMDAPADVSAWMKAFPDYINGEDFDGAPREFKGYTNEQMYREVEEGLSQEMIPSYEGAEIMQDGLRSMGHDSVTHVGGGRHKDSKGVKHRVWIVFDPEQVQVTGKRTPASTSISVDNSAPRPEPIPGERKAAETRIAKVEDTKALADQYRVNPETGDFPEMASIENLKAQGRLTEDDARLLDEAQSDFDNASAYGEALKSVVSCLL
jgi:hypothetical protein